MWLIRHVELMQCGQTREASLVAERIGDIRLISACDSALGSESIHRGVPIGPWVPWMVRDGSPAS